MRAIEAGLMVAKMDQVREVVVVTFCTEREFGDRQWERLHDSLLGWRDSIRGLSHRGRRAEARAGVRRAAAARGGRGW